MANNPSTNLDPWAVTKSTDGSAIGDSALDARYAIGGLAHATAGATFGWDDGVFPSSASGTTILDYRVTPATPSPNMTASVNYGNAQIGRLNQGPYLGTSTAPQTVTFTTSNPSNPRIDYVVIRTQDPGVDSSPTQSWYPVVLAGTPGASPLPPSSLLLDSDLLVAAVTVRTNTTTITTNDISDQRLYVAARGGIYVKSPIDNRPGAFPGQMRYNPATAHYESWDAVAQAWVQMLSLTNWITYTPTLSSTGGGNVGLGAGAVSLGRYQIVGKVCNIHMFYQWGSPPYGGGYGPVFSPLPSGIVSVNNQTQWIQAHLWINNAVAVADYHGQAAIYANYANAAPWFPIASNDCRTSSYQIAANAGVPSHSVPLVSGGYAEGGQLIINGSFEIQ